MRFFLKMLLWLIGIAIIAVLAIIYIPVKRSHSIDEGLASQREEGRGAYLAVLSDCAACHTANPDLPFGGGKPVASPFGNIYASNITPSKQAGIGAYSLEDFRAALRDGLRRDGAHLYPAMPYVNYRHLTDEDIVALYQYFMHDVQPIDEPSPKTDLIFPFNQRWGLRAWNWLALNSDVGFTPRFKNEQLNRGAYIVEGPEHCGACHTPRNLLFQQKGLTSKSPEFLTGAQLGIWHASDLRGPKAQVQDWTMEDFYLYLMTGRNEYTSSVGPMSEAIHDSLRHVKADDVAAITAYLQHIKQEKPLDAAAKQRLQKANETTAMLTKAQPDIALGARLYLDNCNACHFANGRGAPQVFPRLDGASIVNANNPGGLIDVILAGSRLPSTEIRPEELAMPGFAWRLNDAEVAELVNFLRSGWSNDAPPISAKEVTKIRRNLTH